MQSLIVQAKEGFSNIKINKAHINNALNYLEDWLTKSEYKDYVPQIEHLIANKHWDYLLDSFYQLIPFGTGGRRGEVGLGPNRINPWTIKTSAQGHSQYLLKKHGVKAQTRGVVLAYDVRKFLGNKYLSNNLQNPLKNLTSHDLAISAAKVYAANEIKVHMFDGIRTTPELSFAIKYLDAIAGDMFSASHNPPKDNGKKVYDELGGQLIPPDDDLLVSEVNNNVVKIKEMSYANAVDKKLITNIDTIVDEEYIKAATSISLSDERNLSIVYTPLHGCGMTSVYKALKSLGFNVIKDPKTSNPSGSFENITFNIPNPEVIQSFDTTLRFSKEQTADIILSSDPDADRIGILVKHNNDWIFVGGNEIGAILTEYVILKKKKFLKGDETIIKTTVTSNLIKQICERNGVNIIGELLIGFKYIANEMNNLERKGKIDSFLLGCEESHGYLAGNYARDKDAATPAIWLSELAAELKKENKTLINFLDEIYSQYGYFRNYLTEIRLLGAPGKEKINKIQASLRDNPPLNFGDFRVKSFEDCLNRKPIVSETDKFAKDVLIFQLEPVKSTETIKITVRPSGTEPKIKIYFEIGTRPTSHANLEQLKMDLESVLRRLEKSVMMACYKIIGIDFPERGFLLFWQLPLEDKLKYFEIEPKIKQLKNIQGKKERKQELSNLVSFLGSNPLEKIDKAFKAKYKSYVLDYLNLNNDSPKH